MLVGLIDANVFVLLFWSMYSHRLFDFKRDYQRIAYYLKKNYVEVNLRSTQSFVIYIVEAGSAQATVYNTVLQVWLTVEHGY